MKLTVVLVVCFIFCFPRSQANDLDLGKEGSTTKLDVVNTTTRKPFFSLFFDMKPFHFIKNSILKIFRRNRTKHTTTVRTTTPTTTTTEFSLWKPHKSSKMERTEISKITKFGEKSPSSTAKSPKTLKTEYLLKTEDKTKHTTREKFTTTDTTEKSEGTKLSPELTDHFTHPHSPSSKPSYGRLESSKFHLDTKKYSSAVPHVHYSTTEQRSLHLKPSTAHSKTRIYYSPGVDSYEEFETFDYPKRFPTSSSPAYADRTSVPEPYPYPPTWKWNRSISDVFAKIHSSTTYRTKYKYFNTPPRGAIQNQFQEYTYPPYPRVDYYQSTRYRLIRTYRTLNEYYYTRKSPSYLFTRKHDQPHDEYHAIRPETTYYYTKESSEDFKRPVTPYLAVTEPSKTSGSVSTYSSVTSHLPPSTAKETYRYHSTKYDHYRNYTRNKYTHAFFMSQELYDYLTTLIPPRDFYTRARYTSTVKSPIADDTATSTPLHDFHTRGKYTGTVKSSIASDTVTSTPSHDFHTRGRYTGTVKSSIASDTVTSTPSHDFHTRGKYTSSTSTFKSPVADDITTSTSTPARDIYSRSKYASALRSGVSNVSTASSPRHDFSKFHSHSHSHSRHGRPSPSTTPQEFSVFRDVSSAETRKSEQHFTFLHHYGRKVDKGSENDKKNEFNSLAEEMEYHSVSRSLEVHVPEISGLSGYIKHAAKKRAKIDRYLRGEKSLESKSSSSEDKDDKRDLSYWYFFTGTVPDFKKLILTQKGLDSSREEFIPLMKRRIFNPEVYKKHLITRYYPKPFEDIEITRPSKAAPASRSHTAEASPKTHHVRTAQTIETGDTTIPTFPTYKDAAVQNIDPYGLLRKIMHYNMIRRPLVRNGTREGAPSRLHPLNNLPPYLNLPFTLPRRHLMYMDDPKDHHFTLLGKYRIHKNNKTLECVQFPAEFSEPFQAVAPPTQSGFYRVIQRYRINDENKTLEAMTQRTKNGSAHDGVVPYEKSRTFLFEIRFYPLRTNPSTSYWKPNIPTISL